MPARPPKKHGFLSRLFGSDKPKKTPASGVGRYASGMFTRAMEVARGKKDLIDLAMQGSNALSKGNARLGGTNHGKWGDVNLIFRVAGDLIGTEYFKSAPDIIKIAHKATYLSRAALALEEGLQVREGERRTLVGKIIGDADGAQHQLFILKKMREQVANSNMPKAEKKKLIASSLVAEGKAYAALSMISEGLISRADKENFAGAAQRRMEELRTGQFKELNGNALANEIEEIMNLRNLARLRRGDI